MSSISLSSVNIEEVLTNALSQDHQIITKATSILDALSKSDLSSFLMKLGSILSTEGKDKRIRQLSAIVMKNSLLHNTALQSIYHSIPKENKETIKKLVISSLASKEPEVRSSTSTLIAIICKIEQPLIENWPQLIPSLTQNTFNDNINIRLAAIETLGYVCEEISIKSIDQKVVDSILNALIQNLIKINSDNDINHCKENEVICLKCLQALFHVIKFCEKNLSIENENKIIMNAIFECIKKYMNNDNILEKIAMLFIELFSFSSYYDYLYIYFDNIFEFSFYLIDNKYKNNDKLGLLGLEIICTIGDEELSREPSNKIIIKTSTQGLSIEKSNKVSKKYINKVWEKLRELIIKYVSNPNEDEDDNEWTLSKGCLYILSIMVRVVEDTNITTFLKDLDKQINDKNNSNDNKSKCWLLLAATLNANSKESISYLIQNYLFNILDDMVVTNSDVNLKKSSSFLFLKISELYPKLIQVSKLDKIFSVLLQNLTNSSNKISIPEVEINICKIIENIIKVYGDKQTKKGSNYISPYFNDIVNTLLRPASQDAIDSPRLALSRLLTLETLIEYSSHDKQESLLKILINFLKEIEYLSTNYNKLISEGSNSEKIFQLIDYYYTLLRVIFIKYTKFITSSLGYDIWRLTNNIFQLRKTVFEEANMALGALANNMKNTFIIIFPDYLPYLEFSIKSLNISSLCKSGLSSLLSSIRALDKGIVPYSDKIIKALIEVCVSTEVQRNNKTLAITSIGEIAITIESDFEKYLQTVMELLFSACKMAVSNIEDEDEDTIEFIKELRFEIIQTLTCIQFAMEEKKNLMVNYIRNIYEFFGAVVNDDKCIRADILKSILSFIIDNVSAYGKEIKDVCSANFAKLLLKKLKAFNIPSYENEIRQQEEVLRILYDNN